MERDFAAAVYYPFETPPLVFRWSSNFVRRFRIWSDTDITDIYRYHKWIDNIENITTTEPEFVNVQGAQK
jgi:hypothetical protein